jgi:hypothetical protein
MNLNRLSINPKTLSSETKQEIKELLPFFKFLISIGIFSPSGEPISPHRLRCSPFADKRGIKEGTNLN